MVMMLTTTVPAVAFIVHMVKDSLCSRKLLYHASVGSYLLAFAWIILTFMMGTDAWFGKSPTAVNSEVKFLETCLELFECLVIALFELHAVSCLRTYVKILEDGTDLPGH